MRAAPTLLALAAAGLLFGCPEPEPAADPEWTPVFDDLDRVLLSVWGPSLDDLWLAGGALSSTVNNPNALIVHHGPDGWTEHEVGIAQTFWWVFGNASDDVFFVGEGGAIHHYDGTAISAMSSPVTATLFGAWGSAPNDVWAVGGDPLGGGETDVLLHYDGASWTQVTLDAPPGVALFKVWGSAADDVWVVGQRGVILHFDGSAWSTMDSGVTGSLFTVTGTGPDDVWAVGGPPPLLMHYDGVSWTRLENPGLAALLNGVAVASDGSALVVGSNGAKWRRAPDGEWLDEFDNPPYQDLHASWLSPDGRHGVAVGGNFIAPASSARIGVIAYWGPEPPLGALSAP